MLRVVPDSVTLRVGGHPNLLVQPRHEQRPGNTLHYVRVRRTPEEMKWKLSVQFQGEEGIDAGGVTREWYQVCPFHARLLVWYGEAHRVRRMLGG